MPAKLMRIKRSNTAKFVLSRFSSKAIQKLTRIATSCHHVATNCRSAATSWLRQSQWNGTIPFAPFLQVAFRRS